MTYRYFVLVMNPSTGVWFPLLEERQDNLMTWPTFKDADYAGKQNFFGKHEYYAVHDLHNPVTGED